MSFVVDGGGTSGRGKPEGIAQATAKARNGGLGPSVWERCRSVAWAAMRQLQGSVFRQWKQRNFTVFAVVALQERHRSVAGAGLRGLQRLAAAQKRCRSRIERVAASRSGTEPLSGQDWERCSVQERHWNVAGAGLRALQRLGALLERCRGYKCDSCSDP